MRNKYPGVCYRCNQKVEKGQGHFERFKGTWRTQHATCAIYARAAKGLEKLDSLLENGEIPYAAWLIKKKQIEIVVNSEIHRINKGVSNNVTKIIE